MDRFFPENNGNWENVRGIPNRAFVCGFCNTKVSSNIGYTLISFGKNVGGVHICPNCGGPIFLFHDSQYPSAAFGKPVQHVPGDLNTLYEEARRCTSQNCYTGAVLLCRKMLMNIAVAHGAEEGKRFVEYVEFLSGKGFVPPNGQGWVDHIRKKGNEATHEISLMNEADAHTLITFVEMLLRFIYEFPKMIPESPKAA
jgi:hypothetical protein